jgi:hypothetical protein
MAARIRPLFACAALGSLAACASTGERRDSVQATEAPARAATAQAGATDDWELRGWRIIGCCCNSPCPCRINKKPTYCHGCDHTDVVHIDRGHLGDVDMSGVSWTMVGRGFGKDTSATWVYIYVDDDATDAQVEALKTMLNGNVAALKDRAPYLVGNFIGLREVPMKTWVSKEGTAYGCEIPGILDFRTSAIFNPGKSEPVTSTGILDAFADRFVHAEAVAHTWNDPQVGYAWDLTGRQANQAGFVLNQKIADAGHYGWGCWSAHSTFGDESQYVEETVAAGHH